METVSQYQHIIVDLLTDIAEASLQDTVETLPLFDMEHDNYLLLDTGWNGIQRIHHVAVHLRILNDKIWVEADNTDRDIVRRLLDAGVSQAEIVLAFYSLKKRQYTKFAVS